MGKILFKAKRDDNGEWVEGLITVMWGKYLIKGYKEREKEYERANSRNEGRRIRYVYSN